MNPFTAILQAAHSALIDELCERHPEPKPVLGLPSRQALWLPPAPSVKRAFVALFELGKSPGASGSAAASVAASTEGALALAATEGTPHVVGVPIEQLTPRWIARCGTEFHRRGVTPALRPFGWEAFPPLSHDLELHHVTRVIWMPIQLGEAHIYLGIAARAPR